MSFNFDEIRDQIFKAQIIDQKIVSEILLSLDELLVCENNILLLESPIIICGDTHGQMYDLVKLFQISHGFDENKKWTGKKKYLFMGDYVDRGHHSLNTFLLLATLKLQYPDKIFLLRGNHESRQVSMQYGFQTEIIANYGHVGLWSMCNDTFDYLPVAALVDSNIFCVHGGISPSLSSIQQISLIERQKELPEDGLITDLLWSDPDDQIKYFTHSSRGAGYYFGEDQCLAFNRMNHLKMICRSHQLAKEGFHKYFGDSNKNPDWRLITVWSAPDYSYREGNRASVLHINDTESEFQKDGPFFLNLFDKSEERLQPSPDEVPIASYYFM